MILPDDEKDPADITQQDLHDRYFISERNSRTDDR